MGMAYDVFLVFGVLDLVVEDLHFVDRLGHVDFAGNRRLEDGTDRTRRRRR